MSNNMFVIDVMSRVPVYEQVINQVEEKVLKKLLLPGAKMPSVRGLSMELAINPNTGDSIHLWTALLFVSLTGLAGAGYAVSKKLWK